MRRHKESSNKGFTLVEVIVVLVILAILAAILVPTMLHYIDEAKGKEKILNGKNCLTAAQAELTKLYGKNISVPTTNNVNCCVIPGVNKSIWSSKNGDADVQNSEFANNVLAKAELIGDKAPYCLMIAVGSNLDNHHKEKGITWSVTERDKYTVYYILYIQEEGDAPYYYYNGEWTTVNPRYKDSSDVFSEYNVVMTGSIKGKRLQYYMISDKTNKGFPEKSFWNWVKGLE